VRRIHGTCLLAAASCVAISVGCRGRDDLDGRRGPVAGLPTTPQAFRAEGAELPVAYDFVDNRSSLGLVSQGRLVIDCGSPSFATFIEGGYRSQWHLSVEHDGRRAALTSGLAGELYLPLDGDAGGVLPAVGDPAPLRIGMFVRPTKANQLVSVFFNEVRLRDVSMPRTEWGWHEVAVPAKAVRRGENKLRFYFRHTADVGGRSSAAAFARIVVSASSPPSAPVEGRALEVSRIERANGEIRGFELEESARLSAWLRVPDRGARLRLAVSGGGATAALRPAKGRSQTLWTQESSTRWVRRDADLSPWRGQVVRLDLIGRGAVAWGEPRVVRAPPTSEPPVPVRPDYIVVWTVSSLRPDGGGAATPNFDRVRAKGIRFDGLVAASPAPGPAHVALLTGRHPARGRPDEVAKTLGERLGESGWQSGLFSGNGFVNDELGFARGFAAYENPIRSSQPHSGRVLWQMARRFLKQRIDKGQRRALVYVAASEPHLPYTPTSESRERAWSGPAPFEPAQTTSVAGAVASGRRRLTADEQRYLRALYAAEVADVDAAFGTMLADLEELGIADRTAVVLVGDHGEELFERGAVGHGATLRDEVLRTPLVVFMPGALESVRVEATVGAVDVYATVLDLAGVAPGPGAQGQSVLPLGRPGASAPRPAFSHLPNVGRAVTLAGYRLIVPAVRGHQLYEIGAGPGTEGDLMGERPVIERYLRNAFGLHVAYESAWRVVRWGTPDVVTDAFAADQGL